MAEETSLLLARKARPPIFIALSLLALTVVYPFVYLVITSLRSNTDYLRNPLGLPAEWTLHNFVVLLNAYGVGDAFMRTLAVAVVAVLIEVVLASLAGYSLARYAVPGGKLITGAFVSVMLIPGQVLIIPIYLMLSKLGLVGSYGGLVLVYVATGLPFATFFMILSYRSLPQDVLEAARVDGAGFFRTYFWVAMPMGVASTATLVMLEFLGKWNELLFALILLPADKQLLTPTLAQIGGKLDTNQPLVSAGLVVTAFVPLLLLVAASNYIMKGMGMIGAK